MFAPVKQKIAILGILSCVLLSACTPMEMTASPSPGQETSEMHSPVSSTPITQLTVLPQLPTVTSTVQPSPLLSTTPHPNFTATIFPPTQTLTPDAQATLTRKAYDEYTTQIASFPFTCDDDRRTLLSPNGIWLAISCGNSHDQTLEVVRRDGTRWIFQFRDYVHPEFMDGEMTPMGRLEPVQWTADEKYLFFSSHIHFSGGGTCCYLGGDHGLFRLNLTTGAVSVVLPVLGCACGYLYAFSPGARRLAYVANPPVILDIRTGELTTFQVGEVAIGDLTWSPDGRELAYAACRPTSDGQEIESSMVRIYSLNTGLSRTILELEKYFVRIESWDGNQQLKITLEDRQTGDRPFLYYDWETDVLITPTPTE